MGMEFSFCRVDSWDQLRSLDLVSVCYYPVSHPAEPSPTVFLIYNTNMVYWGETMAYKLLVLSSVDSVHVSPVSGQSRQAHEKQPWKSSSLHLISSQIASRKSVHQSLIPLLANS